MLSAATFAGSQLSMISDTMMLFLVFLLAEACVVQVSTERWRYRILVLVYAVLAAVNLFMATEPVPGVRIDTRMGVEAAATLMLGWAGGLCVALVTGLTRLWMGGVGAVPGSIAMLGTWAVTAALLRWQRGAPPGSVDWRAVAVPVLAALSAALAALLGTLWLVHQQQVSLSWAVMGTGGIAQFFVTMLLWGTIALTSSRTKALLGLEQANQALKQSLRQTIGALAQAALHRDPGAALHQRRVADLAQAVGRKLGMNAHDLEGLELAALVHDIGQIEIPSEIMSRPGRLTRAEMALVQQHPVMGYEILKDVRCPWPLAEIVHQHHENLDGSGYPRGLSGDAICLAARIVRVCDIVEAMSSHRVYREALAMEQALAQIESMSGRELDASVVLACLALIREEGYRFPDG